MDKKSFITLGPGGSMGPRYFLQLFYIKIHKIANISATPESSKKIVILRIMKMFDVC